MKRLTLGLLAVLTSASLQAATNLHVKAGQTQTLEGTGSEWVLDELVLEDNATLIVPATAGQVQIDVARAVIGAGANILANGNAGAEGEAGAAIEGQGGACEEGLPGAHGHHGQVGGDGVALNLTVRIAKLGSLTIGTQGGVGGNGGAGGNGQDAGDFDSCSAPKGGDGGRGGDGGDGGNGGHVRVFYTLLPESGLSGGVAERIKVLADGGKGAEPGAGGKGGAGSPGRFITMKTLSGNKKWVAGGKAGVEGAAGKSGRDGAKGQVLIQQDLRSRMDELAQQQSAQAEAINSRLAEKLAEEQAASQALAQQGVATISQEVDALKLAVTGLATQEMVQKQAGDMDARTAKLEQTLEAVMKRLDQLERKLDSLAHTPSAPVPVTP